MDALPRQHQASSSFSSVLFFLCFSSILWRIIPAFSQFTCKFSFFSVVGHLSAGHKPLISLSELLNCGSKNSFHTAHLRPQNMWRAVRRSSVGGWWKETLNIHSLSTRLIEGRIWKRAHLEIGWCAIWQPDSEDAVCEALTQKQFSALFCLGHFSLGILLWNRKTINIHKNSEPIFFHYSIDHIQVYTEAQRGKGGLKFQKENHLGFTHLKKKISFFFFPPKVVTDEIIALKGNWDVFFFPLIHYLSLRWIVLFCVYDLRTGVNKGFARIIFLATFFSPSVKKKSFFKRFFVKPKKHLFFFFCWSKVWSKLFC